MYFYKSLSTDALYYLKGTSHDLQFGGDTELGLYITVMIKNLCFHYCSAY